MAALPLPSLPLPPLSFLCPLVCLLLNGVPPFLLSGTALSAAGFLLTSQGLGRWPLSLYPLYPLSHSSPPSCAYRRLASLVSCCQHRPYCGGLSVDIASTGVNGCLCSPSTGVPSLLLSSTARAAAGPVDIASTGVNGCLCSPSTGVTSLLLSSTACAAAGPVDIASAAVKGCSPSQRHPLYPFSHFSAPRVLVAECRPSSFAIQHRPHRGGFPVDIPWTGVKGCSLFHPHPLHPKFGPRLLDKDIDSYKTKKYSLVDAIAQPQLPREVT
jgi:hypothetical protein